MATTMKKSKATPEVTEETTPEVSSATSVTVNADDLIKSILNNTKTTESHSREYVMCRSVTNGGLNINCKSGNVYEFKNYGDDCEIEYHDLAALVRKHSDHIFIPRFIIEDDSFIEEFPQLNKVYEKLYTSEEIEEILNLPTEQMAAEIKSMPKHVYENLKSLIATKIANGSIDSVRRIRILSEIYDSDFNLLSELFSK